MCHGKEKLSGLIIQVSAIMLINTEPNLVIDITEELYIPLSVQGALLSNSRISVFNNFSPVNQHDSKLRPR